MFNYKHASCEEICCFTPLVVYVGQIRHVCALVLLFAEKHKWHQAVHSDHSSD